MSHPSAASSHRSAQFLPFPQTEASFVLGVADAFYRETARLGDQLAVDLRTSVGTCSRG